MQNLSNKAEKRWNAGITICKEAMDDFATVAVGTSVSTQKQAELASCKLTVMDAFQDYCDKARECATEGGITVNSAPGPK